LSTAMNLTNYLELTRAERHLDRSLAD